MSPKDEFQLLLYDEGIRHFYATELWRHDPPKPLWENIIPTLRVLEEAREKFDAAIYLTSTYRDEKYNRRVGGKPDSLHMQFNAIDFVVKDRTILIDIWKYLASKVWSVSHHGNLITSANMGIGIYDTFCHVDTRGLIGRTAPARWDERK